MPRQLRGALQGANVSTLTKLYHALRYFYTASVRGARERTYPLLNHAGAARSELINSDQAGAARSERIDSNTLHHAIDAVRSERINSDHTVPRQGAVRSERINSNHTVPLQLPVCYCYRVRITARGANTSTLNPEGTTLRGANVSTLTTLQVPVCSPRGCLRTLAPLRAM